MSNDISVVVPVYNSAKSIAELVERIVTTLKKEKKSFEIILVEDHSKDESLAVINGLKERDFRIKVIPLSQNVGQQAAVKIGIMAAKGMVVITIDDDLEHQPEDMTLLLTEIRKGYDVVYGVPINKQYLFYRKLGSRLVGLFFTLFLGKPRNIKVGSFRIINRTTVDRICQDKTPFVYITAMTLKVTKNIGNVAVKHQERQFGKSNYDLKKLMKLFFNLFYYYRKA
ncbi:glycosyltransferase family 2 protein [Acetobacterium woodii]|uniref:Putative sugar transferase n=1 Tax=Acetobacterium woodii (strain ATCC 29683 / DSM 1030 / JCM 2381 / KCTC 1655 / WB1) TaxID=931626 RepID=H6LC66_ACEWD|nr:glycosyltransferase family 2 protein [Acetobacterium woodii]AFA49014.1 putative sugar transferase [Acetobacterium woodii DSM 1030]